MRWVSAWQHLADKYLCRRLSRLPNVLSLVRRGVADSERHGAEARESQSGEDAKVPFDVLL